MSFRYFPHYLLKDIHTDTVNLNHTKAMPAHHNDVGSVMSDSLSERVVHYIFLVSKYTLLSYGKGSSNEICVLTIEKLSFRPVKNCIICSYNLNEHAFLIPAHTSSSRASANRYRSI